MSQVNPCYASVRRDPGLMERELSGLAAHLAAAGKSAGLPLSALMVQHHSGVANAAPYDAPVVPCPGSPVPSAATITDTLCELRFRVSPTAFFQVRGGCLGL